MNQPADAVESGAPAEPQVRALALPRREGLEPSGPSRREIGLWLAIAAVFRLFLAWQVTGFVLVDDAYITLRYARNAAETGSLVYNHGEAVFGVTSPLWGFVTSALMAVFGRGGIEFAVIALGIALWSMAGARLIDFVPTRQQRLTLAVFLWTPVFVDNQMLGMETPLFVALAVFALGAAHEGRIRAAAAWAGWLVISRPEGVLFVPALVWLGATGLPSAGSVSGGVTRLLSQLRRPSTAALLLGPGLAWVGFAMLRYGTVLPQSMVAKSGWNSAHYDSLSSLEAAWFGVARLTFVPFVDYLPLALGHVVVAALVLGAGWVLALNLREGTRWSRAWLLTYCITIVFYIAGKGATEASWYAVPPSVALLIGAGPLLKSLRLDGPRTAYGTAIVLCGLSVAFVQKRAPLLTSYVDGYGACASALEALNEDPRESVLIGEIGVFGFETSHRVIDVGALVSPEILPLKNERLSLVAIAQRTGAAWLVISEIALETNVYPSVGQVWAGDTERAWLEGGTLTARHLDKQLIRLQKGAAASALP